MPSEGGGNSKGSSLRILNQYLTHLKWDKQNNWNLPLTVTVTRFLPVGVSRGGHFLPGNGRVSAVVICKLSYAYFIMVSLDVLYDIGTERFVHFGGVVVSDWLTFKDTEATKEEGCVLGIAAPNFVTLWGTQAIPFLVVRLLEDVSAVLSHSYVFHSCKIDKREV